MNGSKKLSDEEKQEMLKDAKNFERSRAFNAARILSDQGSLDDYIEFLSENIPFFNVVPTKRITTNFKL
jgi:hypothetical protein